MTDPKRAVEEARVWFPSDTQYGCPTCGASNVVLDRLIAAVRWETLQSAMDKTAWETFDTCLSNLTDEARRDYERLTR